MSLSAPHDEYHAKLHQVMTAAGLPSLRALATSSSVSRRQIDRLRQGEAHLLSVQHALQLAGALQLTLPELLNTFGKVEVEAEAEMTPTAAVTTMKEIPPSFQAEYQRLADELAQTRQRLRQDFEAETLNVLESLLLQWPTAAYAARQNPAAPAVKLLPLLKPLDNLLEHWQIEAIGEVGQMVDYDPSLHQWSASTPSPQTGEAVRISHVGYRQADRLLYRARVSLPPPGQ